MDSANGLLEQLDLVKRGGQSWLGATPDGLGGRSNLFGGLVAAQALRAGHLTRDWVASLTRFMPIF